MKLYGAMTVLWATALLPPQAVVAGEKMRDVNSIGTRDVSKGVNFYSIEKEIALGKEMAEEVERTAKLLDDPVICEYVNRLVQNLGRNSDVKLPLSTKVLESSDVNAFALPGGFVFVNSGLMLQAQTEAELAGVLAHEIGHVAARHGTRQASRGEIANLASIPLILMGGWAGYAAGQAANLIVPMTFLEFSRGFEREADLLGLEYMYKAGYDPTAMVDFFERLQSKEKKNAGFFTKLFASHPMTRDRVRNAQAEISRVLAPRPEYVVTRSEFNEVQARLKSIENMHRADKNNSNAPILRRATRGKIQDAGGTGAGGHDGDDERPKLKRQ